ncbi:S8 family serine peptidase [Salinarimonas sp.]|uniref:S8 family peptidase n=1 Tax=Salinarimonas sp. TaxID=2766526 RepID=UPI0032D8BE2C
MPGRKRSRSNQGGVGGGGGDRPRIMPVGGGGTTGATVVRLNREARHRGLGAFEDMKLRIASTADVTAEAALASTFDGADMIVFERFGIAIVQADPDRMAAAVSAGVAEHGVVSARPERIYRAIGAGRGPRTLAGASRDYLLGYRAGVDALVEDLLGGEAGGAGARRAEEPQDPEEITETWGLRATGVTGSCFSGRGIKVAILDTGIDAGHPDFEGRIVASKSFIPDETVEDAQGHGTHCAGTACGPMQPAENQPRYGVAYGAELYVGKVLSNQGLGSDRTVIAGLEWALNEGCQVISMSLGAAVAINQPFDENYELIGQDALRSGSLLVAAAGNESRRPTFVAPVGSPANCPSIFAVAAVDRFDAVAFFSCAKRTMHPGGEINIAGPGVDVLSSMPRALGGWDFLSGTSMATPHVAGIAALYAESDPGLRGMALWGALVKNARHIGGEVADVGAGLVYAP